MSPIALALVLLAKTPITLEQVREESKRSLDAVRAEIQVTSAQAATKGARSTIFPRLGLSLGASDFIAGPQRTFSTVPQVQSDGSLQFVQAAVDTPGFSRGNFQFGVSVQQLLYDGGRWWNQIAQAGAQEKAAQGQLAEQRLASELEATRRFFALLSAQTNLEVLEESVSRSQQMVERAKGLYEAGRSPRSSWLDAQTNLGNDRVNVVRQRQSVVAGRTALLQWLGRADEDIEARPPQGLDVSTPAPAYDAALARARAQRPLLSVLEEQRRSGQLAVDVATSGYWPRLSANAGYGRSAPSADPFFTDLSKQNSFTFGATLSWDLFNGYEHQAGAERARADALALAKEGEQAAIDLQAELRRALASLDSELEVLRIFEENLELAQQQAALEAERFSAGAATSLDVRNAEIKLTQAKLGVVQGRGNVAVARAALFRVVGGSP